MAETELKFANALSLYIHYPFCIHKCPYCDFASTELGADAKRDTIYIKALQAEFQRKLPLLQAPIVSVYVGGGTPSLCEPERMAELLAKIKPHLSLDAEISFEANPGTIDSARLRAFKDVGFNRISIGVQSFNDLALKRLGRIHDRKAAYAALESAMSIFDNVNVDIMHGLPKQTLAEALDDLKVALSFKPQHLSWYELTIEEDTAFGQKPPVLPDEDTLEAIEEQGFAMLSAAGYEHYEVSGYNLGGNYRCRHNMNYWVYGDYLGLGVAAHQKITCLSAKGRALTKALSSIYSQQPTSTKSTKSNLTSEPAYIGDLANFHEPTSSYKPANTGNEDTLLTPDKLQFNLQPKKLACTQANNPLSKAPLAYNLSFDNLESHWRELPEAMTIAVQALQNMQNGVKVNSAPEIKTEAYEVEDKAEDKAEMSDAQASESSAVVSAAGAVAGVCACAGVGAEVKLAKIKRNDFGDEAPSDEGVLSIYRRANSEDFTDYLNEQLRMAQAQASLQFASAEAKSRLAACNAALLDEALAQHWSLPIPSQETLRFTPEQVLRLSAGETVEAEDVPFEYMLNRMRLWDDYWALSEYYIHTGLSADKTILYPLMLLSKLGLIEIKAQGYGGLGAQQFGAQAAATQSLATQAVGVQDDEANEVNGVSDTSNASNEAAASVASLPGTSRHSGNLTAQDDARVLAAIYNLAPQVPALRPSALGKRMLNEILEAFLPDAEQFQFDAQHLQSLLEQAKQVGSTKQAE